LALVFEGRVGKGKILVCSIDLTSTLGQRAVARQFLFSLKKYVGSRDFSPKQNVDLALLKSVFKASSEPR
jgi:hypothetical protein